MTTTSEARISRTSSALKDGANCKASMFALYVNEELDSWPEQEKRERKWLMIPEASQLCRHSWMKDALDKFAEYYDTDVKGSLVRKQTALALQSMQALIRAQATMKPEKSPAFLYDDGKFQTVEMGSSGIIEMNPNFSSPLQIQIPRCRYLRESSSPSITATSTPRISSSVCSSPHWPSYMASTRSSDAKARSPSTPKQRSELLASMMMKGRVSFNENGDSRSSLSGIGKEAMVTLKNAVVGRIDRGLEYRSDHHLMGRFNC